jgi:hypothetical protein
MTDELPDSPFQPIDSETDDMGAGSGMEDTNTAGSPLDRLFDGSAPGPQVGELKADYDMPQWLAVLSRGIMRVATGDGVPPIAEIVIGGVMGAMGMDGLSLSRDGDDNGSRGTQNRDGGPTVNEGAPPNAEL